jgi:hypothetical protein
MLSTTPPCAHRALSGCNQRSRFTRIARPPSIVAK